MQTQPIAIKNLKLDAENPRLKSVSVAGTPTPDELLKTLYSEMSVDEVALSIAENGFFSEEPLLIVKGVTPKKDEEQSYIVIEGNRRLGAVMLLVDDALRNKIEA